MPIILIGDSCSGKTSTLQRLQELGYPVVMEDGWKRIPPSEEQNKCQSNIWFANYFFHRDQEGWGKKVQGKELIFESCLYFQYPFTYAQVQCGKISLTQKGMILALLDSLASKLPLYPDDLVIHFICSPALTNQRLAERGRPQSPSQAEYRSILRKEIGQYFPPKCMYVMIDTLKKDSPALEGVEHLFWRPKNPPVRESARQALGFSPR